jgi:predicted Zn-dependent protease
MLIKICAVLVVLAVLIALSFPRAIPGLLRRLGFGLGRAARLGREIATGVEEPDSPLAHLEARAGEVLAARALAREPACADAALQEKIAALGARLAAHASRREIPYRFLVVESDDPNAYAVPGGTVLVTRPLVALCGDDADALAGVLGHELAHIDLRHALHHIAASLAARTGTRILGAAGGALLAHATRTCEKLLVQGYRQDQELEADRVGAALARSAGHDPRGLGRLLATLERERPEGNEPLWTLFAYFRSHPPVRERITRLERHFGR